MAICPAGHESSQTDFCDVCGLPVTSDQPVVQSTPAAPPVATTVSCPNCQAPNVAEALFCEACGYDFTTGVAPEPVAGAPATSEPVAAAEAAAAEEPPAPAESMPEVTPTPAIAPAATATEDRPVDVAPPVRDTPAPRPAVEWVAELWIDPDWYSAQGSTDPMPSPGLPDIVPLVKESNLIGRVSHSRGIFPDVDCELDNGCSRRHAMLSTDGTRWWIEDLNSANGTFVGGAAGPLPAMPIPQGRVELNPGQRIYVGAWTRIVIRRATEDEKEAFAG